VFIDSAAGLHRSFFFFFFVFVVDEEMRETEQK